MKLKVGDVKLYYEQFGQGPALIFVHGNKEDHQIFKSIAKNLASKFSVYLIDSRGHGRSSKSADISYDLITQDLVKFIKKLKIEKPILIGFSDGGIVGLLLASQYPTLLSKAIICGANLTPLGIRFFPKLLMRIKYIFTGDRYIKMMLKTPFIKGEQLKNISIPTLILAGEKDVIKLEHTKLIHQNINSSELKIIKGHSHSSYLLDTKVFLENIVEFLNK